ncbi:MAG: tetratricopeptide repeat protein [Phycisphaeraceae bacterium]|nr:tetratricopeptide repeat protein [Phycisphaeraceae bacterium]
MPVSPVKFQQAMQLLHAGKYDAAIERLQALQRLDPKDTTVCNALGKAFAETGRYEQSVYYVERCLALNPGDRVAAGNLIHMLGLAGKKKEAAAKGDELFKRFSSDPHFVLVLASTHAGLSHYSRAHQLLTDFMKIYGPVPAMVRYGGSILLNLGLLREAEAAFRESIRMAPDEPTSIGLLAATLNYVPWADRAENFELHRMFGRSAESGHAPVNPLSFANDPDPDRPIRVAVISPDFREHPVARFVEAIMRFRDKRSVHLTGIFMYPTDDDVTVELRALCDGWRTIRTSKPGVISEVVREEKPDVLVEFSGLTANSPLFSMSPRLAPVQVSAIGYPHTTGMSVIDYRIVDSLTDPPGEADRYATETLVRIDPCFLCYTPRNLPPIGTSPAQKNGFVTFGTFNKITKYTDEAFALWSRILDGVPRSKLLIKTAALDGEDVREIMLGRLERAGIPRDRVELAGLQDRAQDHLRMYDRIDIALDTYPYNGTTTTCEALAMGVPVVALEGCVHAGRVGVSLLHAAGMTELLAQTPEEYVERAVGLASKVIAGGAAREQIRKQMLESSLCDGAAYAGRWCGAIRECWRTWCARKRASGATA